MEEDLASPLMLDGTVREITFSLATAEEICSSSANDCPISHPNQLTNPFLGLPLESGKCEACGTTEHGECEGHFGYVALPIPIYHPCHVYELKNILNFLCLKCLRMKKGKVSQNLGGKKHKSSCLYCPELPPISVNEVKTVDGAVGLELKAISRATFRDGFWNFLGRYGFRYGDSYCRSLLPYEVLSILNQISEETRKKLASKGFYPQKGFIMQSLPVPPNCLYSADYADGKSIMSSDISLSMLRRVLNKIELIKRSRSGSPNFESHEFESNDLQAAIMQYMLLRGTQKVRDDVTRKFVRLEESGVSTKQWLDKMRTLFIRKSSGFSSRCVITGDTYRGVNEIGLPLEIAMKITFEERVTIHNMRWLQEIVDNQQCVTYRDGPFTYAVAVGPKRPTSLKVGQVVHRRIMDGDFVFVNRPPSIHGHSLQAFSVYVHNDSTVKINPLICAPLGADFDGDCIHIFYPQSLAAKSEAKELFSVEQQILSTHGGTLNLQLVQDSFLALKLMHRTYFLKKATAQQLGMFSCSILPRPALYKASNDGSFWTGTQILQGVLPSLLDCCGEKYLIRHSEIMMLGFESDSLQSTMAEIITSILSLKGQKQVLGFFNLLQPLLMEFLSLEGFSISLLDFNIPKDVRDDLRRNIEWSFPLLSQLRNTYNEILDSQVENHLKGIKIPVINFIQKHSSLGYLIDSSSDSTISKVVQQLGFVGLQLSVRDKLYSPALVNDIYALFMDNYQLDGVHCPTKAYGLILNSFFHGLDPYEELVHSLDTREVIIRSSAGLTEPGILFKNLMSILRDVVVCYDGTVRNLCTNSIVLFEYGLDDGSNALNDVTAGEPVGVLAATAISNLAYKAVLNPSQGTKSSWELMKEVLVSRVRFKNDAASRRVILYMNDCFCGRSSCKERAVCAVCSFLKKVTLRNCAVDFSIEYKKRIILPATKEVVHGLMAHIHLDQLKLDGLNCKVDDIYHKCLDALRSYGKKRKSLSQILMKVSPSPCLQFLYHDPNADHCVRGMETTIDIMANVICPILLDTAIKGDPRVHSTKIIWVSKDTIPRVGSSRKRTTGEVALEVVIEKDIAKKNGDAWRVAIDCCLPLMHLIDTTRSIPYGIQQIQDYLGISSAFDQSIQRLSTAVRNVSKGILKEHPLLVVHCMTCSGRVIGFYTAGFKSLFRSLDVQVPFTEATLLTPLKCFERAAEKCHRDSLSGVVAACSWGKRVAIGTGGQFQIMWDKKKMAAVEDVDQDVYGFLNLVREASGESGEGTALLGVDIDDLGEDEMVSSPEHDQGLSRLGFDESPEADWGSGSGNGFSLRGGEFPLGSSGWKSGGASAPGSDDWEQWSSGEKQSDAWGNQKSTDVRQVEDSAAVVHSRDELVPSSWGSKSSQRHEPDKERAKRYADATSGNKSIEGDRRESGSATQWESSHARMSNDPWASQKSGQNMPGSSRSKDSQPHPERGIPGASTWRQPVSFTSEEQKILDDLAPVMQSIRQILHQPRYSDGDRLSADDQSYILDNVFRYHPDGGSKVSGEVDYVMVGQPESFPETRCFFVVSSDGSREDFSYLKCMENFVRETYPEIAEAFCSKYFRKRLASDSRDEGRDPL